MYVHGFRFYFTPLTGVLFAFPSRCWFTIGQSGVFSLGGEVWWVNRGELPEWYTVAYKQNTTSWDAQWVLEDHHQLMEQQYPQVHKSEWAWVGARFDQILENNGTLEELYQKIDQAVSRRS